MNRRTRSIVLAHFSYFMLFIYMNCSSSIFFFLMTSNKQTKKTATKTYIHIQHRVTVLVHFSSLFLCLHFLFANQFKNISARFSAHNSEMFTYQNSKPIQFVLQIFFLANSHILTLNEWFSSFFFCSKQLATMTKYRLNIVLHTHSQRCAGVYVCMKCQMKIV